MMYKGNIQQGVDTIKVFTTIGVILAIISAIAIFGIIGNQDMKMLKAQEASFINGNK